LSSVRVFVHPDLPKEHVVISFQFGSRNIFVEALDDDTLQVSSAMNNKDYIELISDYSSPLLRAIGQPLRWVWTMTNNNGYFDGIQMEFAESAKSDANIIQLQVIASRIEYRLVTPID
jgi:hypothetical protein